jgi:hypothetical protein
LIKQELITINFFALPSTGNIDDPIDINAPLAVVNTHPKLLHFSNPSCKAATKALAEKCKNSIDNIDWESHPLPLCDRAWPESWYVIDMVMGFKGINDRTMKKHFPSSAEHC